MERTIEDIEVEDKNETSLNQIEVETEPNSNESSAAHDKHIEHLFEFIIILLTGACLYLVSLSLDASSMQIETIVYFATLWSCSYSGGYIFKLVHLPSMLGMLTVGLLVGNLSPQTPANEDLSGIFTSAGLAVILLRSGLELDLSSLKKASYLTLRLTLIPGCFEAIVTALCGIFIFGMPFWLSISLGFILAAVSPAVVVNGMLKLQHEGYGVEKGIPSLIIASASLDDIVAITGFTICIGFAIADENKSLFQSALHGPIEILLGLGIGTLLGSLMNFTTFLNKSWKKSLVLTMSSLIIMFGMKELQYPSSGAIGCLVGGCVSSYYWSLNEENRHQHRVEQQISRLWNVFFEPLMFAFIGTALNFKNIPSSSIGKSILVIGIGSATRLGIAFAVTYRSSLSLKERVFISLAWLPKATVQAALCSLPLSRVKNTMDADNESYPNYIHWAELIQSTAILAICVTAPIGVLCIKILGKKLLTK